MNIIVLDSANKKLTGVLAESATTQPVFTCHYYDSDTGITEASSDGAFNSTTPVDMVAAPTAKRIIKEITIYNGDDKDHTVAVMLDNDGTARIIWKGVVKESASVFLSEAEATRDTKVSITTTVETADSIEGDGSDGDKIKLVGDVATPDNDKYYGTDDGGNKGYHSLPSEEFTSVETEDSITGDGTPGTPVKLVGDAETPGNEKYYGTDDSGNKGYHDLPEGNGGASTYDDLTDTPASKADKAGHLVQVNSGETAHEYVESKEIPALEEGKIWVGGEEGIETTDLPEGGTSLSKASAAEVDTGTDDEKYVTAKGIKDAKNVPNVAPGTSGNVLTSDGTDWTSAAPSGGGGGDSTKLAGINAQTGTTYTLVLADAGKRVRCTNENAITVTVPQNSSVAYDIGTVIEVEQGGAGVVTLDEDTNVTINSSVKTWGQYSAVRLLKLDTNLWTVDGGSE